MATAGQVSVALARRGTELNRLNAAIAGLDRDLAQGPWDRNGLRTEGRAQHYEWLKAEKTRLEAEVQRLGSLDDDALVAELVPEVARAEALRDVDMPTLTEILPARGTSIPVRKVLHTDAPPVRRTGPEPAMPWNTAGGGAPRTGVVWTYDASGNLVPAP